MLSFSHPLSSMQLMRYIPELARDWTILCVVYAVTTYGHQLLVVHGHMSRRVAIPLQALVETSMLVGCVVYARTQPNWPITQRAGWLIQMAVLLMKMHSYLVTNRHLKMEVRMHGFMSTCAHTLPAFRTCALANGVAYFLDMSPAVTLRSRALLFHAA